MRQVGSATGVGRRRRPRTVVVVAVLLLLLALLELVVIIQVGDLVGALPTVLLVVATSVLGLWLLRREGTRTWRALRGAVESGQTPSRQVADAVLVLVGGLLLLLPGFVSDVVGLVLVLPFTRPVARPLLEASIGRRVFLDLGRLRASTSGGGRGSRGTRHSGSDGGDVVEGEVVDDD